MSHLESAIKDGHAALTGDGKQQKIHYVAADHTERYADPEEQVRAELWAELIYVYGYAPERIGIEITVPRRTPTSVPACRLRCMSATTTTAPNW